MGVGGYFSGLKGLDLREKEVREEVVAGARPVGPPREKAEVRRYRRVEDYDPVLRAHCGVEAD